ncbi:hypothetical protein METH_18850 [Leisingera methylohalidivorans DSM 14336]|uniref:Uncharacterized protein n=1 Tax=Leisingera methylohalidivorans DSM 14336 TaxID=999552 RepID=V9VZU5_9RHOB|nr:hypothetical protein METH_18850 [Leisingera methylohalidivorans DSM 14336]
MPLQETGMFPPDFQKDSSLLDEPRAPGRQVFRQQRGGCRPGRR